MGHFQEDVLSHAREETRPAMPKKIWFRAKLFGKNQQLKFLWNYYERESEGRVPFYLPYVYMKEHFLYLRRYAGVSKKKIDLILIDGEDGRCDYFLYEFLEDLHYLTIVTPRIEYFTGLQERAFQELGLLIDLVLPWEEKQLNGNLVWDFTKQLQKSDCYPEGSYCFLPHKKMWKVKEVLASTKAAAVLFLDSVQLEDYRLAPSFAECLLAPPSYPFRKGYCLELAKWCKSRKWSVKIGAQTREKP